MIDYSDVRYLLSKRPVDDRALNRAVLETLRQKLQDRDRDRPLEILELGAGVGTMVARLADWGIIQNAHFTLVDRDSASLEAAQTELERWADRFESTADGALQLTSGERQLRVRFVLGDALQVVVAPEHRQRYDLVTANAVLDLMDLRPALLRIWQALRPESLFWFSINFDGESIFLPEAPLDEQVLRLYHRTMDERVRDGQPCGDSKTGRHLLQMIPETGAPLLAAGSSDWVVFPTNGKYANDEGYFLHHILHTIWTALSSHPEVEGGALDRGALERWVESRHEQIDQGKLIYVAHQLDLVGHGPPTIQR